MTHALHQPLPDEHAPYFAKYLALIPGGETMAVLRSPELIETIRSIPESLVGHRYAPGKWTVGESIGHVADTERIMVYRALRIARGDAATPLASFDENAFVAHSGFADRSLADLADEFAAVRAATLAFLDGLPEAAWTRRGISGTHPATSVRALAGIIAGHGLHHLALLRDRYLA